MPGAPGSMAAAVVRGGGSGGGGPHAGVPHLSGLALLA
jgi:hypothetical protein